MKIIGLIEKYLLGLILVLFAVFIIPATGAPQLIPRLAFLAFGVALVLLLRLVNSIIKGEMTFNAGKFDIAVVLIMASYILSGIFRSGNKIEAFFFPGAASFVIASSILYFLINQQKKSDKSFFSGLLIMSGVLVSLITLFAQIQFFSKIPQLPAFIKDPNFSPAGGVVPSLIYLAILLPLGIKFIVSQEDLARKIFFAVSTAVILASMAVNIGSILPGKPLSPRFLPLQASWEIAIDSIKESPMLGIGPGNYLTAFNRFRPVQYNMTDLWPVKFTTAFDFYLTVLTEAGLLGAFALGLILFAVYKFISSGKFDFDKVIVLVPVLLFAALPASPTGVFIFFAVLAMVSGSEEKKLELIKNSSPLSVALAGIPFFAGIFALGIIGSNLLRADVSYQKALEALSRNEAQPAYDNMREAINLNPSADRYRASLAELNMALAGSIASKEKITESDRGSISQFIQAAIAEGKSTVALNPQRSENWLVLAAIYRTIMPFAQGADNFAVETYLQAAALDPVNPNLRISLGGVYYALGRFDEAVEAFRFAVTAKPDLANAHYNLAAAYREKGDITKASEEMNIVLSLVGKDSADYQTALKELQDLEGLTEPQETQGSNIKPPLNLPQEANPPLDSN